MTRLTAGEIKGIFFLFKKLLAYFEQREKQAIEKGLEKQAIVYSRASHPLMCIHGTWGFC